MIPARSTFLTAWAQWKHRPGEFSGIPLGLTWFSAGSFVCGATTPVVIGVIGELYVGELLLIQLAFLMLLMKGTKSLPKSPVYVCFLQLVVVMLLGYLLSDIYRDARPAQFLRGWARIILLSLDIAALAIVVANDRRNFWWFVLGMALGGLCDLMVREVSITTTSGWKAGYGMSLATLLVCASCFLSIRVAATGFVLLGIASIVMDYRILGAICIILGMLVWLRSASDRKLAGIVMLRLLLSFAIAVALIAGTMLFTQDDFAKRREESNVGRGAAISVAAWAIAQSPLIGYGSWPMDARLVNLYYNKVDEELGNLDRPRIRINVFVTHSQILQGWVEGGMLGVLFWFSYGYWLVRTGCHVALTRRIDAMQPMYLFFLIYDSWHLLMSPFGGSSRFMIAIGIATICVCADERGGARKATDA